MSHDHGAEVLGDNLDKEVEDHRFRPPMLLDALGPALPILNLEVDMYEDFAGVEEVKLALLWVQICMS